MSFHILLLRCYMNPVLKLCTTILPELMDKIAHIFGVSNETEYVSKAEQVLEILKLHIYECHEILRSSRKYKRGMTWMIGDSEKLNLYYTNKLLCKFDCIKNRIDNLPRLHETNAIVVRAVYEWSLTVRGKRLYVDLSSLQFLRHVDVLYNTAANVNDCEIRSLTLSRFVNELIKVCTNVSYVLYILCAVKDQLETTLHPIKALE